MGYFDLFNPKSAPVKKYQAGDSLTFGKYFFENEQDLRPIEWTVLEVSGRELLLISKYCLDRQLYCTPFGIIPEATIWENSALRDWLNGEFYDRAFTPAEKAAIAETRIVTDETADPARHRNRVFLLSQSQILTLMPRTEDRLGIATPYVRKQIQEPDSAGCWWWTLPSTDTHSSPRWDCPSVCFGGEVHFHSRLVGSPGAHNTTVRPAIRIRK